MKYIVVLAYFVAFSFHINKKLIKQINKTIYFTTNPNVLVQHLMWDNDIQELRGKARILVSDVTNNLVDATIRYHFEAHKDIKRLILEWQMFQYNLKGWDWK
jgi:hypothetical protein